MKVRATIALLAALAILAVSAGWATAAKAPTSVSLTEVVEVATGSGDGEYSGRVDSTRKRCRRYRLVRVIHKTDPRGVIGETRSGYRGNWAVTGTLPPDGDRVVVKVKRTKRCKGARAMYEIRR